MEEFLFIMAFIFVFLLWLRTRHFKQKIAELETKVVAFEKILELMKETGVIPESVWNSWNKKKPDKGPIPVSVKETSPRAIPLQPELKIQSPAYNKRKEPSKAAKSELKPEIQKTKKVVPNLWEKLEKQLALNWTGILGSAILIMGVGFLGIYALLTLEAVFRFAIIFLIAVALFIIHLLFKNKSNWQNFASWMRSSASAVLLFAFIGAGGIPGLKFIDNQGIALALVIIGIMLNLYSGYAGGTQYFVSLHCLISLAGMAIVPQSNMTLIIGSVIVFFSIAISFRSRWDYHLLVTISSFFIYHLYWYYNSQTTASHMDVDMRITGIASVLAVGIIAIISHYREIYKSVKFDKLAFTIHFLNWAFLAIELLFYSTGSKWNSIVFAIAAAIIFFTAKRGKEIGIRWLYLTDILISQTLALFTVISLSRWGMDYLLIAAIAYVEIIIFYIIMNLEGDRFLQKTGTALHHISILALICISIWSFNYNDNPELIKNSIVIGVAIFIETVFHLYHVRKYGEVFDSFASYSSTETTGKISISGFLIPVLCVVLWSFIYEHFWACVLISVIAIVLLFVRLKIQSNGIGIGLAIFIPIVFITAWIYLLIPDNLTQAKILIYNIPLFVLALISIKASYAGALDKHVKWPGVYLFTINLAVLSYIFFQLVSVFISGVLWLVFSMVYLEAAKRLENKFGDKLVQTGCVDSHLINSGYFFIGAFILRHFLVHIQSGLYIGFIPVRLMIEIFGLLVFLYWAVTKPPKRVTPYLSWKYLHPLFWELIIIFSMTILLLEIPAQYHPVLWIAGAIALISTGKVFSDTVSRFRFYSLFFHWIALFTIAFVLVSHIVPSNAFYDQIWFFGSIAIITQFIYIMIFYKNNDLESISLPLPVAFIKNFINFVSKHKNIAIYYPFFISIAIFIRKSFAESLQTLLWVAEAFSIFVASVILKENHFRFLAMAVLAACLIRLMIYDLAQSGTIIKGLVFVCVGALMLAMNMIYIKYRHRF